MSADGVNMNETERSTVLALRQAVCLQLSVASLVPKTTAVPTSEVNDFKRGLGKSLFFEKTPSAVACVRFQASAGGASVQPAPRLTETPQTPHATTHHSEVNDIITFDGTVRDAGRPSANPSPEEMCGAEARPVKLELAAASAASAHTGMDVDPKVHEHAQAPFTEIRHVSEAVLREVVAVSTAVSHLATAPQPDEHNSMSAKVAAAQLASSAALLTPQISSVGAGDASPVPVPDIQRGINMFPCVSEALGSHGQSEDTVMVAVVAQAPAASASQSACIINEIESVPALSSAFPSLTELTPPPQATQATGEPQPVSTVASPLAAPQQVNLSSGMDIDTTATGASVSAVGSVVVMGVTDACLIPTPIPVPAITAATGNVSVGCSDAAAGDVMQCDHAVTPTHLMSELVTALAPISMSSDPATTSFHAAVRVSDVAMHVSACDDAAAAPHQVEVVTPAIIMVLPVGAHSLSPTAPVCRVAAPDVSIAAVEVNSGTTGECMGVQPPDALTANGDGMEVDATTGVPSAIQAEVNVVALLNSPSLTTVGVVVECKRLHDEAARNLNVGRDRLGAKSDAVNIDTTAPVMSELPVSPLLDTVTHCNTVDIDTTAPVISELTVSSPLDSVQLKEDIMDTTAEVTLGLELEAPLPEEVLSGCTAPLLCNAANNQSNECATVALADTSVAHAAPNTMFTSPSANQHDVEMADAPVQVSAPESHLPESHLPGDHTTAAACDIVIGAASNCTELALLAPPPCTSAVPQLDFQASMRVVQVDTTVPSTGMQPSPCQIEARQVRVSTEHETPSVVTAAMAVELASEAAAIAPAPKAPSQSTPSVGESASDEPLAQSWSCVVVVDQHAVDGSLQHPTAVPPIEAIDAMHLGVAAPAPTHLEATSLSSIIPVSLSMDVPAVVLTPEVSVVNAHSYTIDTTLVPATPNTATTATAAPLNVDAPSTGPLGGGKSVVFKWEVSNQAVVRGVNTAWVAPRPGDHPNSGSTTATLTTLAATRASGGHGAASTTTLDAVCTTAATERSPAPAASAVHAGVKRKFIPPAPPLRAPSHSLPQALPSSQLETRFEECIAAVQADNATVLQIAEYRKYKRLCELASDHVAAVATGPKPKRVKEPLNPRAVLPKYARIVTTKGEVGDDDEPLTDVGGPSILPLERQRVEFGASAWGTRGQGSSGGLMNETCDAYET